MLPPWRTYTVGAASKWWSNEGMMVYFKLMMVKRSLMMVKCSSMMVKWLYDHIRISPSLTSISPSLTNISPSLTSILPSFAHLTIIEKLHRLLYAWPSIIRLTKAHILVIKICKLQAAFTRGLFCYSWFHIKGTWSVHSFNGDYLSIPKCTGSCEYLFREIPSMWNKILN